MTENPSLLKYFEQSPLIIQSAWIISGIFLLIIVPLIFYLKYLRGHLRENEKIDVQYQQEYEEYLISYLYTGNEVEDISVEQGLIIDKLKISIKDPFKRKIVVSTLLKLKNEISGEIADSIQKLYFQTGLINYTLPKLRSKKMVLRC